MKPVIVIDLMHMHEMADLTHFPPLFLQIVLGCRGSPWCRWYPHQRPW